MNKMKRALLIAALAVLALSIAAAALLMRKAPDELSIPAPEKPVIYLYPTQKTDVDITLDYRGTLSYTYPAYKDGWRVTAYPGGTIINRDDGREYSYLFWEGHGEADYDFSRGFVVAGHETEAFLEETLARMGLIPKEYNEFIVYWVPRMKDNAYNLIAFQQEAYTESAQLTIDPAPDSLLRVFMAYKVLDEPMQIPQQEIAGFARQGFAAVEWGGAEIP